MLKKHLIILVLAFIAFTTPGCFGPWFVQTDPIDVQISVLNESNDPVHIWKNGQSIGPENKVYPDENAAFFTTWYYYEAEDNADSGWLNMTFSLFAGRDGETIHSQEFELTYSEYKKGLVEIGWNGSSFILK